MSDLKSIELALELATRRRDEANRVLSQTWRAQLYAQGQMEQLESYATESQSKWGTGAKVLTSAEMLRQHYQFMERLQAAIQMQGVSLDDSRHKVEVAKQHALAAEFRLAALQQVLKRKQAERARLQARREQRQMDEFASQQHARRRADMHSGG